MQDKVKDTQLSKKLSWILRHGAVREGLQISDKGYINVSDILNHKNFKNYYSIDDIITTVKTNDKQRFCLCYNENGELQICASQGHSIQVSSV